MTEILAYRIPEACRAIGVGVTRLYQLIGEGKIEARKAGKMTVIPANSLKSYIDSLPPATIRTGQKAAA